MELPFNTLNGMQIVTTASKNAAKTAINIDEETYSPEMNIEPWSVSTYIFVKSSMRDDIGGGETEQAESIFSDNFDLYGASCVPAGWRAKYESGTREAGNYDQGPRACPKDGRASSMMAPYAPPVTTAATRVSWASRPRVPCSMPSTSAPEMPAVATPAMERSPTTVCHWNPATIPSPTRWLDGRLPQA